LRTVKYEFEVECVSVRELKDYYFFGSLFGRKYKNQVEQHSGKEEVLLDRSDYESEKEIDEAAVEILEDHYANFSNVKYRLVEKTVID
jgi:hypothetical protein